MSLSTNVTNLATRVATEIKAVRTLVNGNASDLSALDTTAKTNLVAAINELNTEIENIDLSALIDDSSTATTTTWSSTKIGTAIDAAVTALVDGAPDLLNTLNELAAALGDDEDFATTITTSIGTKLSKSGDSMTGNLAMGTNSITGLATPTANDHAATKGYVDTEITTLSTAVGDTDANYVTTFEAGLV